MRATTISPVTDIGVFGTRVGSTLGMVIAGAGAGAGALAIGVGLWLGRQLPEKVA